MLRLIKNRCQKLAYASVAENRSQKLTYLASGDWQPVPKCIPFFLFLLPRRSLHFSKQLHFSLLSPCNLAKMRAFFSFSSSPPQSPFHSTTPFLSSLSLQPTPLPSPVRCRRWFTVSLVRCHRWFAAAAGSMHLHFLHLHFLFPWLNLICSF